MESRPPSVSHTQSEQSKQASTPLLARKAVEKIVINVSIEKSNIPKRNKSTAFGRELGLESSSEASEDKAFSSTCMRGKVGVFPEQAKWSMKFLGVGECHGW